MPVSGSCIRIRRYLIKKTLYFNIKNITGRTKDTTKLGKREKILIRKTGSEIIAAYDNSGIFPEQSLYFLYDLIPNYDYYIILSMVNSKLFSWIYHTEFITNDESIAQLKNFDLDNFPIKQIKYTEKLKALVLDTINRKMQGKDATENFNKIDNIIYKLYQLTYDEVLVVDSEFSMSRKEYEKMSKL